MQWSLSIWIGLQEIFLCDQTSKSYRTRSTNHQIDEKELYSTLPNLTEVAGSPVLLLNNSNFTHLLIERTHEQNFHSGVSETNLKTNKKQNLYSSRTHSGATADMTMCTLSATLARSIQNACDCTNTAPLCYRGNTIFWNQFGLPKTTVHKKCWRSFYRVSHYATQKGVRRMWLSLICWHVWLWGYWDSF